ncbi:MAG: methionyl-tRNA formyltransferase, partial [Cytophagaceae bacterium]
AVKVLALKHNLPILQPEKVNCEDTYAFLDKLDPDILTVIAYGGFLGKKLLEPRRFPPVNVHPSLLPDLRGAAPMQWALLRGYPRTGVTTQFMVKEMDAGDVLLQTNDEIGENENAAELQMRLKVVGAALLVRTLDGLADGSVKPVPQDGSKATLAPLLTKEQGLLHFAKKHAAVLHDQARGLYPWPGAYTYLQGKRVKILRTLNSIETPRGRPGTFWFERERLFVTCHDSALEILELQIEGKRAMLPKEFANGIGSLHPPYTFDQEPA